MAKFKFTSHKSEIDKKVDANIQALLMAWGITAMNFASGNAPVDTGNLASSIDFDIDPSEGVTIVGTNVEYATYVETNDNAHHEVGKAHFMRDSVANHTDLYQQMAKTYLTM